MSDQLSDDLDSRAGTPMDGGGRSQQVNGPMPQGGRLRTWLRDEEATVAEFTHSMTAAQESAIRKAQPSHGSQST